VQPRKILVVDDSKLMHKMYAVMLRQYPMAFAANGREALDRLHDDWHRDIDLVLLDINMPGMSGLELLSTIRSEDAFVDLPVIIISTEGREDDIVRGLEAGASAYIKKPFQSEDLIYLIAHLEKGSAV